MKIKSKKTKYLISLLALPLISVPIIATACAQEEKHESKLELDKDFKNEISFNKEVFSFSKLSDLEINYSLINDLLNKREITSKRHAPTDEEISSIIKEIIDKYQIRKQNFKLDKDILIAPLSALNPSQSYHYEVVDQNAIFSIKNNSVLYLKKEYVKSVYDDQKTNYSVDLKISTNTNQTTTKTFYVNFNKYDLNQTKEQIGLYTYNKNELKTSAPNNVQEYKIEGFNNSELVQWSDLLFENVFDVNLLNGYSPQQSNQPIVFNKQNDESFYVDSIQTNVSHFQGDATKLKIKITNANNEIIEYPLEFSKQNQSLITYEQNRVQFDNYLKIFDLNQQAFEQLVLDKEANKNHQLRLILDRYIKNIYNFNYRTHWPINQVINKTSWSIYNFDFKINQLVKKIELIYQTEDESIKPVINNFFIIKQPTIKQTIDLKTTKIENKDYNLIDSVDGIEINFEQPSTLNGILIKKENLSESLLREYLLPNNKVSYLVEIQDNNNQNYNFVINKDIGYLNYLQIPQKFSTIIVKKLKLKPLTLKELVKDIKLYK